MSANRYRSPRALAMGATALGVVGFVASVAAQQPGLEVGAQQANFGVHELQPGFMPDPKDIPVTSGGDLDVSTLNIGRGCRGWATRRPDAVVRLGGTSQLLRFYVTPGDGRSDTTLIVNHANGSWRCNDDSWGGLNPTVDIRNATAGQYDVWVGSYHQGEHVRATLHVTELVANHP